LRTSTKRACRLDTSMPGSTWRTVPGVVPVNAGAAPRCMVAIAGRASPTSTSCTNLPLNALRVKRGLPLATATAEHSVSSGAWRPAATSGARSQPFGVWPNSTTSGVSAFTCASIARS
jgi:hypothetical protein